MLLSSFFCFLLLQPLFSQTMPVSETSNFTFHPMALANFPNYTVFHNRVSFQGQQTKNNFDLKLFSEYLKEKVSLFSSYLTVMSTLIAFISETYYDIINNVLQTTTTLSLDMDTVPTNISAYFNDPRYVSRISHILLDAIELLEVFTEYVSAKHPTNKIYLLDGSLDALIDLVFKWRDLVKTIQLNNAATLPISLFPKFEAFMRNVKENPYIHRYSYIRPSANQRIKKIVLLNELFLQTKMNNLQIVARQGKTQLKNCEQLNRDCDMIVESYSVLSGWLTDAIRILALAMNGLMEVDVDELEAMLQIKRKKWDQCEIKLVDLML